MRTLIFVLLYTLSVYTNGQVIPGEEPGDNGWIMVGTDTIRLVRANDGNVWMQQSLGSSDVAIAADDSLAYGGLYQWGRWTDGHQLRTSATALTSTLPSNDPLGLDLGSPFFYIGTAWWTDGSQNDTWQGELASATNGIDPCTSLGSNWHVPTRQEWIDVVSAEAIADIASAFNSHLKLTTSGSRHGFTAGINPLIFGSYWTSTAIASGFAKNIIFRANDVWTDHTEWRNSGLSVRCMNSVLHVGSMEVPRPGEVLIYPNPSTGLIKIDGLIDPITIEVRDMLSRPVMHSPIKDDPFTIDLTGLPDGTYLIKLITREGTRQKLVIIER